MFSKTVYGERGRTPASLLLVLGLIGTSAICEAQKFLPDDPIWVDEDNVITVDEIPQHRLSDFYDFLENTFSSPGDSTRRRALNINSLGEVPDSSWFQNRHGRERMSIAELTLGPNDPRTRVEYKPWTIIAAKTEGITPGFTVRNRAHQVFFVKFDPLSNPEMATAAEIISTKFLHAMGYNVPGNYLAFADPDEFEISPEALVTVTGGGQRSMTRKDLEDIFKRVHRLPDGSYRAIASKRLEGTPIGPFRYYETRSDDPNDVFPHEHRRELRGLWVLSSWLNHDDSRSINSLDVLVEEENRRFVKHYLIDFGSTLGSGSTGPQKPRAGFEYMWEAKPSFARMLTLGLWDRKWIRAKYPDLPAVGRLESVMFEPPEWKPEYPNPAFTRCDLEDAYWAAKIVMRFTDEEVRAIVESGQMSDPAAEHYLYQTLRARRDKIGGYWLNKVSSFDNFRIETDGYLVFDHLASRYGFVQPPSSFEAQWFTFDNQNDESTPLGEKESHVSMRVPLPARARRAADGIYFGVALRSLESPDTDLKTILIYFRHHGGRPEIVGIEREP